MRAILKNHNKVQLKVYMFEVLILILEQFEKGLFLIKHYFDKKSIINGQNNMHIICISMQRTNLTERINKYIQELDFNLKISLSYNIFLDLHFITF